MAEATTTTTNQQATGTGNTDSQLLAGLSSVQTMLAYLSKSLDNTNSDMLTYAELREEQINNLSNSIVNLEKNKTDILKIMTGTLSSVDETLTASYSKIQDWLENTYTKSMGVYIPKYLSDAKYLQSTRKAIEAEQEALREKRQNESGSVLMLLTQANNLLSTIATKEAKEPETEEKVKDKDIPKNISSFQKSMIDFVKKIHLEITNSSKEIIKLLKQKTTAQSKNSGSEDNEETPVSLKTISELAKNISRMAESVKPALAKNLMKVASAIERIFNTKTDNAEKVNKNFSEFADSLETATGNLKGASIGLVSLAGALLLFTVSAPLAIPGMLLLAGFMWMMKKTLPEEEQTKAIFDFSKGIGILTLSLIAMRFVEFSSVLMMVSFIGGLGFVLSKYWKQKEIANITKFSMGIGILTLSLLAMNYVSFAAPFMMIAFIWGLGKVLKDKTFGGGVGKEIINFSLGIGILTLAMFAMDELPFTAMLKMLTFIGGLGLVIRITGGRKMSNITGFAFGVGILTLAMFAMDELPFTAMLKTLAFIAGLGLVIRLTGGNSATKGLPGFAFGLGLMVLAMYALDQVPIEMMFKSIVFIAGLGLALKLYPKTSMWMMPLIAAGILGIAFSLKMLGNSGVSWEHVGIMLATVAGLGVEMLLLGAGSALIMTGALTMGVMALSAIGIAAALAIVSKSEIEHEKLITFGLGIIGLATTFMLVTPFALLGVAGAALFIPISVSALLAAGSLAAISALEYNEEKYKSFASGIKEIAWAYGKAFPAILLGVVGAALFVPIAVSSLAAAGVLALISNVNTKPDKVKLVTDTMGKLVDGINDFGLIKLGKTSVKAAMLIPVCQVGMKIATMLKELGEVEMSPKQLEKFTSIVTTYIDTMANVINDSVSKIDGAQPGIDAIAKLSNVPASLLDALQKFVNMEVVEHEVRNGQLVAKSVRKFDIAQLGDSFEKTLGTILAAFINPLNALVNNTPVKMLDGGWFKADTVDNRGIERVKELVNVYGPLVDAIKSYMESGLATMTEDQVTALNRNIVQTTTGMITAIQKIAEAQTFDGDVSKITTSVQNMFQSFKGVSEIEKFNSATDVMMSKLSDETRWTKIHKNLEKTGKEFGVIAQNIRGIDISKAAALERNLKLLVENNNAYELRECVEMLAQLLGMITETQQQMQQRITETAPDSTEKTDETKPTTVVTDKKEKNSSDEKTTEVIQMMMEKISSGLSAINQRLNQTLNVRPVTPANSL